MKAADVTDDYRTILPLTPRAHIFEGNTMVADVADDYQTVLLATARAHIFGRDSRQRLARILCDPGSQVSFISERLANNLNLPRSKYEVMVEGIGASACSLTRGSVQFTIQSTHSNYSLVMRGLVLGSITSVSPAVHIPMSQWSHLAGLQLADLQFGTPGNIDVLIGADVWGLILEQDVIHGKHGEPHAQKTKLGWVIFGPVSKAASTTASLRSYSTHVLEEHRLDDLLTNFWKMEEVPLVMNSTNDDCERIFSTTHTRTTSGRYTVSLLFKQDALQLGDSYNNAMNQFLRLERRLASNPEMRAKYIAFMREYNDLGHMERISTPDLHSGCYYIPHHAVLAKFRVVFNASAPTSNGHSLNDIQQVGQTIQDSLINILFRFRRYSVALTADVEKMFRQVLVAPQHRDFQRILWRESPTEDIGTYQLTTVVYGMACSPYNAVRALNQCAYDNANLIDDRDQALVAQKAILSSFYVDDFLTSCNTTAEAVQLARNVDTILSAGCFKLRKWNSNDTAIINQIAPTSLSTECSIGSTMTTVLGLHWDPGTDELLFKIMLKQRNDIPTKRSVLSEVAQLFDPTGFLSPVVIVGKIFIQTLWSAGITWDTALTADLSDKWITFRDGLHALQQLRVPRWLGMKDGQHTTLLGFCDASQRAYAAVIYARTIDSTGTCRVNLLTARTRVAPLKHATMPRLELTAALLLANTLDNVRKALGLLDTPSHLWSDSTIVLCWIRKEHTSLKPYVANRVRQIQELTHADQWHYVRSAQNPADCASRGITARELLQHPLWWSGPNWLVNETLPHTSEPELLAVEQDTIREAEKVQTFTTAIMKQTLTTLRVDGQRIPLTERFSSLHKLLRTTALVLRWLPNRRHFRQPLVHAQEMEDAEETLVRMDQDVVFGQDIQRLQQGSTLSKSSNLLALNPYLDDHGILRVGGRLTKSTLAETCRHPIIVPKSTDLARLLIHHTHVVTMHGGTQLMLQTLRRRYWIIHARQAVRSVIHQCTVCRRHRGATLTQQMASLPRHRVNAARPFLSSGVDYCGPFTVRVGTKRSRTTVKSYLAIFICMATKAVHIEVVDDLSSPAFLDAYARFTGRRGPCRDLYSDNGTTFVGANRLLKEDLTSWHAEHNQQHLANQGTRWHFITPRAPHQGGLWEAAVKSAKKHLLKVVGSQSFWYTQLQTLAVRIEACLNSRPLVPLHDDPEDKYALTPGDFLIGSPLLAVPEADVTSVPTNRVKHWQWLRQLHQQFWYRWSKEYLTTLQTRSKWQNRIGNLSLGDIVLVKEDNMPPTHWRLGRVTDVHFGTDGLVRNATLATAHGPCSRAVQKLCLLLHPDDFEPNGSTGQDV